MGLSSAMVDSSGSVAIHAHGESIVNGNMKLHEQSSASLLDTQVFCHLLSCR